MQGLLRVWLWLRVSHFCWEAPFECDLKWHNGLESQSNLRPPQYAMNHELIDRIKQHVWLNYEKHSLVIFSKKWNNVLTSVSFNQFLAFFHSPFFEFSWKLLYIVIVQWTFASVKNLAIVNRFVWLEFWSSRELSGMTKLVFCMQFQLLNASFCVPFCSSFKNKTIFFFKD